ncbi:MAG: hypothetical protein LBB05_00340 [Puniceicoccales bacterium]|jgi:hypothetical protein|nr:hypothetical protein [Puniceicoccales bacterium]
MEYVQKKLLSHLSILVSGIGLNGSHLWGTELTSPNSINAIGFQESTFNGKLELVADDPIDMPIATIYSSKVHKGIDWNLLGKLCQRVTDKRKKFKTTNLLILQNTTSGIFYTFLGGILPQNDLKLDEIDALKIFGCNDLRNYFVQLAENPTDIKRAKIKIIEEALKKYFEKIDEYITFSEKKFDGTMQQNIKKLHKQFQIVQNKLFEGGTRIHAQDLLSLLESVNHLQLNFPEGTPFNTFQELFHPEMLLFYAMENGIMINDFNFAVFKRQNPLYIGLYHDMCLSCETLLAWFANGTDRADKPLIVSSISPSEHPTRFPNSQFLRYTALQNFIKIALQKQNFNIKF